MLPSSSNASTPHALTALSPEALDFAPGLLAIQENPPARLPRAVLYLVAALFVILLLWAIFGRLDIINSADGRLVPRSYVKIVQPADAGIVKEILVHEGQSVRAGQVLLRMDAQDSEADAQSLHTQLALRSLQLRRIDAELSGRPLVPTAGDPSDLFAQVNAQYHDRRQTYLDALQQAQQASSKAQHDYIAATAVRNKLRGTQPILESQLATYVDLGKKGYVGKLQVGDKQREYLENTEDLRAQEATVASLSDAVVMSGQQVSEITSKYRSDLQNERIDAEADYRKLQQDMAKQVHRTALLELKAPQAGIVEDLATHTIGTVVSAGTVLLSLVPENESLVAEVQVKNDDIGFVRPGQEVKLKLAAYPFQQYGLLEGEVLQVSPDTSEGNDAASPKLRTSSSVADQTTAPASYRALITLDRQTLDVRKQSLKLVPGMQVVAEIHQGSRTVLQYLLSPVQKTMAESGQER